MATGMWSRRNKNLRRLAKARAKGLCPQCKKRKPRK